MTTQSNMPVRTCVSIVFVERSVTKKIEAETCTQYGTVFHDNEEIATRRF